MASNLPPQWLGLLRWTLKYNDGTRNTDVRPMDDEDRKFLEHVMKNLVVDENEKMRVGITTLKLPEPGQPISSETPLLIEGGSSGESGSKIEGGVQSAAPELGSDSKGQDTEETSNLERELEELDQKESSKPEMFRKKEDALEMLDDIVLNGDNAHNFVKLGGLGPLFQCLTSFHPPIVQKGCQLIANIAQNNPVVQTEILKAGGLQKLIDLIKDVDIIMETLGKVVGAVSAVIRHHRAGELAFKKANGLIWLLKKIDSIKEDSKKHPTRVMMKSLALLRHFIDTDKASKDLLVIIGAPKIIITKIRHENVDIREKSLGLLNDLVKDGPSAKKAQGQLLKLGARIDIEKRIKEVESYIKEGDEDDTELYREEKSLLNSLLKLLPTN